MGREWTGCRRPYHLLFLHLGCFRHFAGAGHAPIHINGTSLGTLQATSSTDWQQFYTTWNSGDATAANISLVNLNTQANGNDFALDNIAFDTVAPNSAAVPEPTSVALIGLGLAGISLLRRRNQKA